MASNETVMKNFANNAIIILPAKNPEKIKKKTCVLDTLHATVSNCPKGHLASYVHLIAITLS